MLRAIIFDVDGVLVKTRMADTLAYQKMLAKAGYDLPAIQEITAVVHLPLWEGVKQLLGTNDIDEINRVRDILLEPGVSHKSFIKPQENLEQIVQALSKKYRLAIVTGRFKQGIDELFKEQKIGHLFEQVITYEDTERHKPDPEPLLLALRRMDIPSQEAVYVGDMAYDVEAASAAGMLSILVSQKQVIDANIWIQRFDQIIAATAKLQEDT